MNSDASLPSGEVRWGTIKKQGINTRGKLRGTENEKDKR